MGGYRSPDTRHYLKGNNAMPKIKIIEEDDGYLETPFDNLEVGDSFIFENDYYIKTAIEEGNGDITNQDGICAVNLQTGHIDTLLLGRMSIVVPVDLELRRAKSGN